MIRRLGWVFLLVMVAVPAVAQDRFTSSTQAIQVRSRKAVVKAVVATPSPSTVAQGKPVWERHGMTAEAYYKALGDGSVLPEEDKQLANAERAQQVVDKATEKAAVQVSRMAQRQADAAQASTVSATDNGVGTAKTPVKLLIVGGSTGHVDDSRVNSTTYDHYYHRANCSLLQNRASNLRTLGFALSLGAEPCSTCLPPVIGQ